MATAEYRRLNNNMDPTEAAGLRQTTVTHETGRLVSIYHAQESGMESDPEAGRWMLVCEEHSMCVLTDTIRLARRHAANPIGWCEPCRVALANAVSAVGKVLWARGQR